MPTITEPTDDVKAQPTKRRKREQGLPDESTGEEEKPKPKRAPRRKKSPRHEPSLGSNENASKEPTKAAPKSKAKGRKKREPRAKSPPKVPPMAKSQKPEEHSKATAKEETTSESTVTPKGKEIPSNVVEKEPSPEAETLPPRPPSTITKETLSRKSPVYTLRLQDTPDDMEKEARGSSIIPDI